MQEQDLDGKLALRVQRFEHASTYNSCCDAL
jgi:hypothetical protein